MSKTAIKVMTGETVDMLKGKLRLSVAESRDLLEEISLYGDGGLKGFDLGIVAVGILSRHRMPELMPGTREHLPFIFEQHDAQGSLKGFKKGFRLLADELEIDYLDDVLNDVPTEETTCALHSETGLWLTAQLTFPTVEEIAMLQVCPDTSIIEKFRIVDEQDGWGFDPTLGYLA